MSKTSNNIFFVEVHFEISEFESGWSYKKDMWHPIISIIISENCFVWFVCSLLVCVFVCVCVCVMFEYMNSVCSQTCKRSFVVTLYISKWSETKPWHWMIDWDTTKDFSVASIFSITQEIAFLSLINRTWLKRETTSTQVILNNESNLINDIHKLFV